MVVTSPAAVSWPGPSVQPLDSPAPRASAENNACRATRRNDQTSAIPTFDDATVADSWFAGRYGTLRTERKDRDHHEFRDTDRRRNARWAGAARRSESSRRPRPGSWPDPCRLRESWLRRSARRSPGGAEWGRPRVAVSAGDGGDRQTPTRTRRGRPRADGVGGRDRDDDGPASLRRYLASLAPASGFFGGRTHLRSSPRRARVQAFSRAPRPAD